MQFAKQLTYVYNCYLQSDTSKAVCGQSEGMSSSPCQHTGMSRVLTDPQDSETRHPWFWISSENCPSRPFSHRHLLCVPAAFHLLPPGTELGLFQQPGLWFGVHVWKQDLKLQLAQLAFHCPHIFSCIHLYWEAYKKRVKQKNN